MTDVELKYNPYSNETHILVNGKPLPESEVKEYVGAEQEISAWARNFWERIATKCNDDFTVRFCGLAKDYKTIAEEFRKYKETTTDDVSLEPDYIVNPDRIHDEQHVKDELDIVFGKKSVEHPVLTECPDCKAQIPEGSTYCPACGKKQDGTARIDESRQYVEQYLAGTEAGEETKESFRALYELLQPLFAEKEAVQEEAVQEEASEKPRQQVTDLSAFEFIRKGKRFVLSILRDKSLEQVVIPDCITKIGFGAFSECNRLTSVVIPDSVTEIDGHAFSECSGLASVVIPGSVTEIGDAAFQGCSSLTSVVIPDSVTKIECAAFSGCSSLTSVVIPGSVTKIGDAAFRDCSNLASVVIPGSVTKIGDSAFQGCSSLESVVIPDSVTEIGNYAFAECSSLMSVVIPNSVKKIGIEAFEKCSSLTSVVIPDSVTEIGWDAFQGCSSLKSVELPSSTNIAGAFPDDTVIKTYNPLMKSAAKVVGSAAIVAAGLMAAPIAFAKAVSETAQTNDRK